MNPYGRKPICPMSGRDMPSPRLVNTKKGMASFVSSIPPTSTIYVALVGWNLGRHGRIFFIVIFVYPMMYMGLIDVPALGGAIFTAKGEDGRTLKSIFENPWPMKCFWDVRPNADALWALCGVGVSNAVDLQLLENATRAGDKTYVFDLDPCILADLDINSGDRKTWQRANESVARSTAATMFTHRPMNPDAVLYCVNRVVYLPALHLLYKNHLQAAWLAWVMHASMRRARQVQVTGYDPQLSHMTLSPWYDGLGRPLWTFGDHVEATQDQWAEEEEPYSQLEPGADSEDTVVLPSSTQWP